MTWIYSPSLPYSQGRPRRVESYPLPESLPAPSAMSKTTRPASPYSGPGSQRAVLMMLPSGMMCEPLMGNNGADLWISSLRAFRVSRTALLENGEGLPTSATYGRTRGELLATWHPASSSWRTPQASFLTGMQELSPGNFPRWGMTRNGELWELTMLAQLTSGTGGGYWPTADANTSTYSNGLRGPNLRQRASARPTPDSFAALDNPPMGKEETGENQHSLKLVHAAQKWMSPNAGLERSKTQHDGSYRPGLRQQAAMWATPTSRDTKRKDIPNRQGTHSLSHQVQEDITGFPLGLQAQMTMRDGRMSFPSGLNSHLPLPLAKSMSMESVTQQHTGDRLLKRRLNVLFVEWLMGWPIGWTAAEGVSRTSRLKMCGNGQVPQSGALFLRVSMWMFRGAK